MGRGQETGNQVLIFQASQALDQFKYEVASELNVDTSKIQNDYWGEVSSRECGAVGGNMVRRMIAAAEQSLMDQTAVGVKAGFSQTLGSFTTPGFGSGGPQNQQ